MIIRAAFIAGSLLFATIALGHQVWIERGPGQSAKVFHGEPAAGFIEKAGGGLDKIQPIVFHADKSKPLAQTRHDDHIQVSGVSSGDLRLVVENFPIWKEADGSSQRAVYYAREGRSETKQVLALELVPTAAGSDAFILMRDGKPVAGHDIALLAPGGWSKSLKTDSNGRVNLETPWPGRYIAEALLEDESKTRHNGQEISKTYHVSTIAFTEEG